jgi:hypothetical protein
MSAMSATDNLRFNRIDMLTLVGSRSATSTRVIAFLKAHEGKDHGIEP